MCLLHNSNIQKTCIKIGYFVDLCMQGKKNFTPQLFVSVNLLDMVPEDNFYRKLQTELNLHFIYKATQKYYGKEGQESIDPVNFVRNLRRKLCFLLVCLQDFIGRLFE